MQRPDLAEQLRRLVQQKKKAIAATLDEHTRCTDAYAALKEADRAMVAWIGEHSIVVIACLNSDVPSPED